MSLESYCNLIRCGILKYCNEVQSETNKEDIVTQMIEEDLQWCKYEAFSFGFEELIVNEQTLKSTKIKMIHLENKNKNLLEENKKKTDEILNLKMQLLQQRNSELNLKNKKALSK